MSKNCFGVGATYGFAKKVHPGLAKPPLKLNGGLSKLLLVSLVKQATVILTTMK